MVTVVAQEQCLARRRGGAYELVTVLKVNKASARVNLANGTVATLPFDSLWKLKKRKTRRTSAFFKKSSNYYHPRPRAWRFAHKRLSIEPVCYGHGFKRGDFWTILTDERIRSSALCVFNDNTTQWEEFGLNPEKEQHAGAGNACARPWQHLGDSIGMPTGPFRDLMQTHKVSLRGEPATMHTAKEIIDEAAERIVDTLLHNTDKRIVYYSVDNPDDRQIGVATFRNAVGADVIDYISATLQDIPRRVSLKRTYRAAWVARMP